MEIFARPRHFQNLREEFAAQADALSARTNVIDPIGISPAAAEQVVDYLASARAALGVLPTQKTILLERFFDESGGMQLVVHSPFGSRINRAWGLALRKRFCRKFNFELQAAATEDAIVLSLSTSHSFPLEEVSRYLHSNSVRTVLIQALRWTIRLATECVERSLPVPEWVADAIEP